MLCHAAQLPAQAVRDISAIKNDPHLEATGFFKRRTHPTEGDYFEIQSPIRFDDYVRPVLDHAPKLGEHSEEVRFVANEHHTMHLAP